MACKNCGSNLPAEASYCSECGAKVIRKRLTIRNIANDVGAQLFSLDNTLFRTFRDMLSQPQNVIECYVQGIRKRYMNPIGFYAISIALTGIVFIILRDVYEINLTENSFSGAEFSKLDFIFDYQGLLSYVIVPFYAVLTWLLFIDYNKYNYTEHLVANTYISAQLLFVQIVISLPLFGVTNLPYDIFTWVYLIISVVYQFYVFKKIHNTGIWSILMRAILYFGLFVVLMLGLGTLIIMVSLLTGHLTPEDLQGFK